MSEVAFEARKVLDLVEERLAYHRNQEHKWAEEEKSRIHEDNWTHGYYCKARALEHNHAWRELMSVKSGVERILKEARIEAKFQAAGYSAGREAGDFFEFTGHPELILKGIQDGDPEILDQLPNPDFSGEFAGAPTWASTYCYITEIDEQDFPEDTDSEFDVYSNAFHQGVEDAVSDRLRRAAS